jgi:hypothetical protein
VSSEKETGNAGSTSYSAAPFLHSMRLYPLIATSCAVLAAETPNPVVEKFTTSRMDELLELYRDFGLPLPPADAPLVKTPTGWSHQLDSGKHDPIFTLGFLLKAAEGDAPAEVLVGPLRFKKELSRSDGQPTPVKPDEVDIAQLSFGQRISTFPLDTTLATAIQCHARGYEKLAEALFSKAPTMRWEGNPIAVSSGGPWTKHRQPTDYRGQPSDDAATRLAGIAWTYWMNSIVEPDSDWTVAAASMKKILAATPALDDAIRKEFLSSLEAALRPGTAASGSIEAEIDALANCSAPDELYQRVLLRGFAGVPALIDHIDDARLTRSIMMGFNNFPTMPRRVGELASDLLQDIAGAELSRDWLQRQLGVDVQKQAAVKWWNKAKAKGEEEYVREHVIPGDRKAENTHEPHLKIIETRYPRYLPGIYTEILKKRTGIQSQSVVAAIERSALPLDQKLALFKNGASHRVLKHRLPAIRALRKVDPAAADAATLKFIQELPKKTRAPVWTADEGDVANLVIDSPSAQVWDALLAVARRAHVSLRMELMKPMTYSYIGEPQRAQRLHFLAQFLDDDTLRDSAHDPKLYEGPCAGFTFDRITVRDFAAMQLASLLEFAKDPESDWTQQDWTDLRAKVKAALKTAGE